MPCTRREFVIGSLGSLAAASVAHGAERSRADARLAREVGITTGSFMAHMRKSPEMHQTWLLELPARMRDMDMRVIDVMSETLASTEAEYLADLRSRAEKHGCVITNLKMNAKVDLANPDAATRSAAIAEFKRWIDVAARLGTRWVRPTLVGKRPEMAVLVASLHELLDYSGPKGIGVLIENNTWLQGDPDALPQVIAAMGDADVAAQPDTGNWRDEARYPGLEKAFPLAATCDFKARQLGPDNEHPEYNLERCFHLGWQAGFRGPWCIEHFHDNVDGLMQGFATIRDMLRRWMNDR